MKKPTSDHRIVSLDLSRGAIVALMALDHVRTFFTGAQFDPTDLSQTTLTYFLTRFVTHFCAPGFFFISGMSVALMEPRMESKAATARRLLVRGLWLIGLEMTVVSFAWSFSPGWRWFGVLWGLGASFVALSALMFVPRSALLIAGLAFACLHNTVWPVGAQDGAWKSANVLLYATGVTILPSLGKRLVLYPLLPWLALMLIGYASGPWLFGGATSRRERLRCVGTALIAAFAILRGFNLYGAPSLGAPDTDNAGFDPHGTVAHAIMSFLNVAKYPPSLQFYLVTVGTMLLLLSSFTRWDGALRLPTLLRPLAVFGRVPFAFYLMHLYLIHALAFAVAFYLGWPYAMLIWRGVEPNLKPPIGFGFGLSGVYCMWFLVLLLLYPVCVYFAAVKRRHAGSRLLRLL